MTQILEADETSQVIATLPPPMEQPRSYLTDLRQLALALPVGIIQQAMAEYAEKRKTFREWLRSQLVEGVHFGYPPGCRKSDAKPSEWTNKPSLYKAGAEFVVDLMGLRPEYAADMDGWIQLGSKPDKLIYKCKLFSRSNEELVGEGTGARRVGQKGGDENNTVKMAQKAALVAAVLNSYGLSDLFTQDVEDGKHDPHANPEPDPNAPTATPRNKRPPKTATKANTSGVTMPDVSQISSAWKRDNKSVAENKAAFADWVFQTTGRDFDCRALSGWTRPDVTKCLSALGLDPVLASDPEGAPF